MDDLLTQVHAVLSTTPARWLGLAQAPPAELLTRRPAAGESSAVDCLRHLLDTERYVSPPRVEAFLAGRDFAAFNPDAEGTQPDEHENPGAMAAECARLRSESLAAHELMHTVQAERALMQPFIAGRGAWRIYFTDHDVEAKTE